MLILIGQASGLGARTNLGVSENASPRSPRDATTTDRFTAQAGNEDWEFHKGMPENREDLQEAEPGT